MVYKETTQGKAQSESLRKNEDSSSWNDIDFRAKSGKDKHFLRVAKTHILLKSILEYFESV